jgi:hypothetical protein
VRAAFYIENTYNHTPFVRFEEDRYPYTVTAYYAPTCEWSFTFGYANFSNWIDQDIQLGGSDRIATGYHNNEWEPSPAFTAPWRYKGRSDVVNVAAAYAYSHALVLTGGFEYVHGLNIFAEPPFPGIGVPGATDLSIATAEFANTPLYPQPDGPPPYTDLPGYSAVRSNIYRVSTGLDYLFRPGLSAYGRYNYYLYDGNQAYLNGESHMFLAGLAGTY